MHTKYSHNVQGIILSEQTNKRNHYHLMTLFGKYSSMSSR